MVTRARPLDGASGTGVRPRFFKPGWPGMNASFQGGPRCGDLRCASCRRGGIPSPPGRFAAVINRLTVSARIPTCDALGWASHAVEMRASTMNAVSNSAVTPRFRCRDWTPERARVEHGVGSTADNRHLHARLVPALDGLLLQAIKPGTMQASFFGAQKFEFPCWTGDRIHPAGLLHPFLFVNFRPHV